MSAIFFFIFIIVFKMQRYNFFAISTQNIQNYCFCSPFFFPFLTKNSTPRAAVKAAARL